MMIRAGLLVLTLGVLGGMGLAQETGPAAVAVAKRPMTFADLMAMKRVSDPQISATGKWVLFSVTEVSLEKNTKVTNLWVVPLGGGGGVTADSSAALRNDKQDGARQLTFGVVDQTFGRFSPDGKWVSLISAGGGSSQIWTAAWDEGSGTIKKPYPLTDIATGADGAVWSPDSKRLLFVSSVYPECSVKGGVVAPGSLAGSTFMVPTLRDGTAKDGAPEQLGTPASWAEEDSCNKAKDEAAAKSAVKAQVWDSLLYRHWNAFTGKKRSHVLVVERANGEAVRDLTPASVVGDAETPTFSLGGPIGYAWAPGSEEIAYVTNLDKVPAASTNNDVFTLRIDEPGAKPDWISTSQGSDDAPAYSPDGRYLAYRSQARAGYESDRFRLVLYDRREQKIREMMPKFDHWIDEFTWSPKSDKIYFTTSYLGEEPVYSVNLDGSDLAKVEDPNLRGEFGELQSSSDGSFLVATRMAVDSPATIYVFSTKRETGWTNDPLTLKSQAAALLDHADIHADFYPVQFHQLTHLNDEVLKAIAIDQLESFFFAGAGGTHVQAFVVKPPNFDPAKKYPLKFLIHGGPQGAWGDAWSYRWNAELMAASGYVVVMVNPRGSTGYGQAFIDGVNGDWGGKAYVDLMKGLDAAEAKFPFIDKTRECALGASYGGFMANWILTHTNRFQCIVTHDGMYNPAAAYGDTEEMWFNEWEFRRAGDKEPGQPWRYASLPAAEDPFRRWSPMLHIKNAKTPTLVIHSQRDYRLDVSEGFQLFTALQRLNVPSKMLYFPDEGHWVLKPQNSQLWYETVGDWCDRWTKSGRYAVASK